MRPSALFPLFLASACSAAAPIDTSVGVPAPLASAPAQAASAAQPTAAAGATEPAPAWKSPPPPDALIGELAQATRERRDEILKELGTRHGGAALVAALSALGDGPVDARWVWQHRVFDAIDACADPRAADALAARGAELGAIAPRSKSADPAVEGERSLRGYARTRVGLALADLGDLRALPMLVERLGVDPTVAFAPERFWENDMGGHLSKSDSLRVASVRMLSELFDANPSAPASTWVDAERAVFAWVDQKPQPHGNAMRFLARVRSDRGLRALRKWAFPSDPVPKVGATPPFPVAFENAQMALTYMGLADPKSAPRLVTELTRKPADFDGSQDALMNGGVGMRGMAFRALGYGAASGLALAHDPASVDALWKVARDPKTHEEVRQTAAEALGSIGDLTTLRIALPEAVTHSSGVTPEEELLSVLMFTTLAQAAHPKVAPDLLAVLERAPTGKLAEQAGLVLSLTPLEAADEARLRTLVGRAPARAEVLSAALWASDVDVAVIAQERAKLSDVELATLDQALFHTSSSTVRGPHAPERISRWAARAHAYTQKTKSEMADAGLRAGLGGVPPGGAEWTRAGLRRALITLARKGDAGAVQALAIWDVPGPLLALASGDGGVPEAVVRAARTELSARWP